MSRRHKLTCGFQELSLSLLEMQENVKGVDWGSELLQPFLHVLFLC